MSQKKTNQLQNTDPKSFVLTLAVLAAVVIGLSNFLTGNVAKTNSFYIDKGHFFSSTSDSQCKKLGGESFSVGAQGKIINGKMVKIISGSSDIVLVDVDGNRRTLDPGHEKYVGGLYITLYAISTNDACLIVRD